MFEALGFYLWSGSAESIFYNSDAKRRLGPPAVYFDMTNAVILPVAIVREYLIRQGFNRASLDAVIAALDE